MTDHVGRFIDGLAVLVTLAFLWMLVYLLFVVAPQAGIAIVVLLVVSYIIGAVSERVDI